MEQPLIRKKRFAESIETLNPQTTINTFILIFALLQLAGETLALTQLMHLKPIPIILMIIKSVWVVECSKFISFGLAMGLVGDILLMFPTTLLFQFGAVSFLFGHLLYISCFAKNSKKDQDCLWFQKYLQHLMSMLIISSLLTNALTLWDYLPDRNLFLLYGFILSIMVITSFYRSSSYQNMIPYLYGVIGALSFLVSDYLIAYTKFMGLQTGFNGLFIMTLYYFGQFMILKGNSTKKAIIRV